MGRVARSASMAPLLLTPSPRCPSAQAPGTMRSFSHCAWLLGPSINDSAHFWASVGWLGRANFGWSWVR